MSNNADFSELLRTETMPPDVFKGGTGDLVICQEWSTETNERYLRIKVPMADAVALAEGILAVARGAR
jgi:hypothetical protein